MFLKNDSWLDSACIVSLKNGFIYIGYGAFQKFESYDQVDPQKPAFYIPDFFLQESLPWIQYELWSELSTAEFKKVFKEDYQYEEIHWDIGHADLFSAAFRELQEEFSNNRLDKAVPYIFAYASEKMSRDRLKRSLNKALSVIERYPSYLYAHWNGDHGFLGVTPEILFQHCQKTPQILYTMALAGTQKEKGNQNEFEENEKELMEHRLVIDGISQTLQHIGNIRVGQTEVLQLPSLKHLLTQIELDLNSPFDFTSIVQFVHPTPALGAFPRQAGKVWLENYQSQLDRQNYGAPFGIQFGAKGLSFCLVAIRQVQWNEQGMRIGAGCGIIRKSLFSQEWDEIQLKIRAIRNTLAL